MKRRKKSSQTGRTGLLGVLSLLGSLLLLLNWGGVLKPRKKTITISRDAGNIYRLLLSEGISDEYAKYMTAQSAHETANFTSVLYQDYFNAFGMTYVGQSEAKTGVILPGGKVIYASYKDWSYSVKDYKRLWKSYGLVLFANVEQFVRLLKQKDYFTAPEKEYREAVKNWLDFYFPGGKLLPELEIPGAGGTW